MLRELLACKPGSSGKLLDWLPRFGDSSVIYGNLERSELGNLIISYFEQLQVRDFTRGFGRFIDVLNLAASLRSDSNYEALLIAHEDRHDLMTKAFTELANVMSRAAETCLPLVSDAFSAFVESDPDLGPERDAYRAFLYDYLHKRVVTAIGRKLGGFLHLLARLSQIAEGIQTTRPATPRLSVGWRCLFSTRNADS